MVSTPFGATVAAPNLFAAGKPLFDRYCSGCHDIGLGARNGEGPVLNGIIGRPAGTIGGYDYSPAHKRSAVIWTDRSLTDFIADPRAYLPGTLMLIPGVGSEAERKAIAAYIGGFDSKGRLKQSGGRL